MCGIVGYVGKKDAVDIMLRGLTALRYRGYDSAGIAAVGRQKISVIKTVKEIEELREQAERSGLKGNVGIGHTRWATHGRPSVINAHPIMSEKGNFAVVHNGIIENYAGLKGELEAEGTVFNSDTDTEVVAALLEREYKEDLLLAVRSVLSLLKGSYALGIVCKNHPDTIIAARNFSPLIIGAAQDGNYLASDISAVLPFTDSVLYLEDGEIAVIKEDRLSIYGADGEKKEKQPRKTFLSFSGNDKGEYDYYMMKEIKEQPTVIRRCISENTENGKVCFKGFNFTKEKLKNINKIHIVACGSAYHAGVVGKYIFEHLLGIPAEADTAGEYRYRENPVDAHTLVFAISQSGETADTLSAAKKARDKGAYLISVVNVEGSSLAYLGDDVLYTLAGNEISVATTKGYSTQLIILYLFALWAAEKTGKINEKAAEKLLGEISAVPAKIEEIFTYESKIAEMAKRAVKRELKTVFFIGRNTDYAVALEASLKLKEISYINSSAFAAAELKHGTISLIEEGTAVAALCCKEALKEKMYSNIKEVKARGAYVVSLTFKGDREIFSVSDENIEIPVINDLFSPSLEVIPFQLFAYYTALYKGFDIDKPRNLAKSVTVE